MKSPSSMRNGRFHPPKCRGKLQKNGSVGHPFSQNPWPILMMQKKKGKKCKKSQKMGASP
jgi:hypothetical protein